MNDPGKPKVGLLPLMLEMYKTFLPEMQKKQRPFIDGVADRLKGFAEVKRTGVCTNKREVRTSIEKFEVENVDIMVIIFITNKSEAANNNFSLNFKVVMDTFIKLWIKICVDYAVSLI